MSLTAKLEVLPGVSRSDCASVGELVAAIRRFATVEPALPPFTWATKAVQIPPSPWRHTPSATGHWPLAAHTIAGPLMRRGGRGCPGRRVRGVQRVSAGGLSAGVGRGCAGEVVDARVEAVVGDQQWSPGRLFAAEVGDLVGQVVAQRPGAVTPEARHAGQVDPRVEGSAYGWVGAVLAGVVVAALQHGGVGLLDAGQVGLEREGPEPLVEAAGPA